MNNIFVSVIIPFHNTKIGQFEELVECLSLVDNSFFEFIFINDHTDNINIYEKEICKLNSSCLIDLANKSGVSSARNRGIELAKGKYISFVDSDDLINFELMSTLNFEEESSSLIIFQEESFFNKKKPFVTKTSSELLSNILTKKDVEELFVNYKHIDLAHMNYSMRALHGKLFRASYLKKTTYFAEDVPFYEDSLYIAEYIEKLPNDSIIKLFNCVAYYYRVDFSSASRRHNKDYIDNYSKYYFMFVKRVCSNKRFYIPLVLDTLKTVLPVKLAQAFKGFHFVECRRILRSDCISNAANTFFDIGYQDNDLEKVCFHIINHHYVRAFIYIICNRFAISMKLRFNRIVKHG